MKSLRLGFILHFTTLSVIAATLFGVADTNARKIITKHKNPPSKIYSASAQKKYDIVIIDSLNQSGDSIISFSGFDKPTTSSHESFFVTNNSRRAIKAFDIILTYNTLNKRQLNSQKKHIDINIMPGETRIVTIPAWDKQHSFHYHLSIEAKRGSYPFDVIIKPTAIYFEK